MWDVADVIDDNKKITQFVGALRKGSLTRYMNFTENQARSKDEIKMNFVAFFKIEDVAHLVSQKMKDIKQIPREIVREYDKRFKDLLSKIRYNIDGNLLVQWYVAGLLHHVRVPVRMHDIKTLEEAFKKS